MNIALALWRTARRFPAQPAVFHGELLTWTYDDLHECASSVARHLRASLLLAEGARVGVYLPNLPEYLPVLYGIWYAGCVAVPLNIKLHRNELLFILGHCGAAAVVSSGPAIGAEEGDPLPAGCVAVEAIDLLAAGSKKGNDSIAERAESDSAWLFYTSGTTGRPKGVVLTHANLASMVTCYFSGVDTVDSGDVVAYAAPFSHGAGLYALPFIQKGARHVFPESGHFDSAEIATLAARHRNLVMFAAPTMVKRLVRHVRATNADPSGFKTIIYGGGPMYTEDIRDALSCMGNRFVQIYGQGESPMTITTLDKRALADTSHPRYLERLASVGVPQALVEVRVVDADGSPLPSGTSGEVVVRGGTVMEGYWDDPEASSRALRDGWLWTGDVGTFDDDGFLTLQDRSKDVIISGGSNIYPREVEDVILRSDAVREVSVVGRPNADWGEEVIAFVVVHPGMSTTAVALDRLCTSNIARFKRPKAYRFVMSLPKNEYGKVLKTVLRARAAEPEAEHSVGAA